MQPLLVIAALTAATLLATNRVDADPAPEAGLAEQRKKAETLERQGKHIECGRAYMAMFEANPEASDMDVVLYNAGVCFEQGRAIGLAIRTFESLLRSFPRSSLANRTLVRKGSLHAAIVDFASAAEAYERYARRYAGEKDAPLMLAAAIRYRTALGHDDEAIADTELFVKFYGRKMKHEAAAALFGLGDLYERQGKPKKTISAYKRYIKEIRRSGGTDRLLIAHAKIGEVLWKQSCPHASEDGTCIRLDRKRTRRGTRSKGKAARPSRCGPRSIVRTTVVPRDSRLSKEAGKHFRLVLSLAKKRPMEEAPNPARKAAVAYWLRASKFYQNQRRYEELLSLDLSRELRLAAGRGDASAPERRLREWAKDTRARAKELMRRYEEIEELKGGGHTWGIAAAARGGQLFEHHASVLRAASIPGALRRGPSPRERIDSLCHAATSEADAFDEAAIERYFSCLQRTKKLDWPSRWSELCEEKLVRLRPADVPRASETHNTSVPIPALITTAGLATETR